MVFNSTLFLATFLTAVSLYFPESGNPNLQPRDTPQTDVLPEYDFIIVGAGSAGCVVANRLTENKQWNVLLLEAAGDEDAVSEAPHLRSYAQESGKNWNYTTVKQEKACLVSEGICNYPRGRVMGGSSTINAMVYVRGNKADYDGWAAAGNTGWNYEDVLPYFIKAENYTLPSFRNSSYFGHHGYLNVQYATDISPLAHKFIQAGIEFGWVDGNYNEWNQEKMGLVQNTIDGPSRESTSKAYLNPIRDRPNLSVVKHAFVSKLLIEGNFVNGVEYYRNDKKYTVLATKEVIVSAGAIDTPKLLMLSGIGPREDLEKHNIPLKADLPVGEHLQDHVLVPIVFEIGVNLTVLPNLWSTNESILKYTIDKQGPLTSDGIEVIKFLNVLNKTKLPNCQLYFSSSLESSRMISDKQIIAISVGNLRSKSIGKVQLKSEKWTDSPLINPNYFENNVDFEVIEKGLKLIFEYIKTPTMASLKPKFSSEFFTNCQMSQDTNFTDEFIKCMIENYSSTNYHPVSTARMGPLTYKESVVTPNLLVKGFLNLRVIDASVMPYIVRGNTNGPTIMIAEKGADIVKARYAFIG